MLSSRFLSAFPWQLGRLHSYTAEGSRRLFRSSGFRASRSRSARSVLVLGNSNRPTSAARTARYGTQASEKGSRHHVDLPTSHSACPLGCPLKMSLDLGPASPRSQGSSCDPSVLRLQDVEISFMSNHARLPMVWRTLHAPWTARRIGRLARLLLQYPGCLSYRRPGLGNPKNNHRGVAEYPPGCGSFRALFHCSPYISLRTPTGTVQSVCATFRPLLVLAWG